MKDTDYAYPVAYIKTMENKMLTKNELESVLNAASFSDALKLLTDRGYGAEESVEEILKNEQERAWTEAQAVCPKDAPLDLLFLGNDFQNLKTVLKAVMTGNEWDELMLRPCAVEPELVYNAVRTTDFSLLPEWLSVPAARAYELIAATTDGQLAEIYLDKASLLEVKKRADAEKNDFLTGWAELNILLANLKTAVRASAAKKERGFIHDALIPCAGINIDALATAAVESSTAVLDYIASAGYAEAAKLCGESYSEFEKWCDNERMLYVQSARRKSFGFEPIMAFLIGKTAELQALRIILSGRRNNVPTEIIRERLREAYV